VVGDWVATDLRANEGTASIHAVITRRTRIQRRAPADHGAPMQILAANVDIVMVATSLNRDLNARRLERFVATAWESGGRPVIVLTKVDLATDPVELAVDEAQLEELAVGVPVLATSAVTGEGLADVRALLRTGTTIALLGSSGVGKSTLINALLGEPLLATGAVREDDARGRHTTSGRQLVLLPGGGLLLDTPGIRELALWDDGAGLAAAFADVELAATRCRFSDCTHERQPGCAIEAAVARGELAADRVAGWHKLIREERHQAVERDAIARRAERKRWTVIGRAGAARALEKRGGHGR
jgi:ribosome biogenesis GTPase